MISKNVKINVGDYVNFNIKKVTHSESGARLYQQEHLVGRVTMLTNRDSIVLYKVKVRNRNEYYELSRFKITHVWYTIDNVAEQYESNTG